MKSSSLALTTWDSSKTSIIELLSHQYLVQRYCIEKTKEYSKNPWNKQLPLYKEFDLDFQEDKNIKNSLYIRLKMYISNKRNMKCSY